MNVLTFEEAPAKTGDSLMIPLDEAKKLNWWGTIYAAKSICSTNIAFAGTPGKHVMKFLVESENPAQECDYASSLWLLCISHTNMESDANPNTLAGETHSAEQLNIPACLHTNYQPNQTLQVTSVERRQSGLIHCCVSELYGCSSSQDFWAC